MCITFIKLDITGYSALPSLPD